MKDIKMEANRLLRECGISPTLNGFNYLSESLCMIEGGATIKGITKKGGIYDIIARKFDTSHSRVERDLRYALGYFKKSYLAKDTVFHLTNTSMLFMLSEELHKRLNS